MANVKRPGSARDADARLQMPEVDCLQFSRMRDIASYHEICQPTAHSILLGPVTDVWNP